MSKQKPPHICSYIHNTYVISKKKSGLYQKLPSESHDHSLSPQHRLCSSQSTLTGFFFAPSICSETIFCIFKSIPQPCLPFNLQYEMTLSDISKAITLHLHLWCARLLFLLRCKLPENVCLISLAFKGSIHLEQCLCYARYLNACVNNCVLHRCEE